MRLLHLPLVLLLALLPACSRTLDDAALKGIHRAHVAQLAKDYGDAAALEARLEAARSGKEGAQAARNRILNDLIFLIDMRYHSIERGLYGKKAGYDFGSDFAATTLSSISALTGTESVKTTLSALAAGITSTHASFSKNVLQDLQITAVIYKMRAMRATRLAILLQGMGQPPATYSIEQGIVDLGEYYNAGTFTAAVSELAVSAAAEQKQKEKVILEKKVGATTADALEP